MKKLLYLFICFVFLCSFGCSEDSCSEDYSVFKKGGLYGIISKDRTVVMQANYNYISINSNSIICSKGRVKEIYNPSLKLLFSNSGVNLNFYTEDTILIKESMTGKTQALNVVTEKLRDFEENKKYNIEEGYRENVGLVWEKSNDKFLYSIVNIKGKVLLTDIEQAHSVYSNGMLAVIMSDGKSGFVDKNGKMVIEASFYIEPSDIGPRKEPVIRYFFKDDYALVKNSNKKWVQYTINGEMKVLPDYIKPAAYCYENSLVPVLNTKTMKYGYMNPKFEIEIPCEFDEAREFSGLYAVVKYKNEDAIVDREGNIYFSENMTVP